MRHRGPDQFRRGPVSPGNAKSAKEPRNNNSSASDVARPLSRLAVCRVPTHRDAAGTSACATKSTPPNVKLFLREPIVGRGPGQMARGLPAPARISPPPAAEYKQQHNNDQ